MSETKSEVKFCTCDSFDCPFHPSNHENGCTPCIAKNLKMREIPTCFFNLADPDGGRDGYKFEDFAKAVMK